MSGPLQSTNHLHHRVDEVIVRLATDATVRETDHIAFHAYNRFGVDVDLAKVVDEHSDLSDRDLR